MQRCWRWRPSPNAFFAHAAIFFQEHTDANASPPASRPGAPSSGYQRHRPETTALYEVVRDNLETLYGAIDDGALEVRLPKHAKKELEAYLDCGLLCRGFARLRCTSCEHSQLVA